MRIQKFFSGACALSVSFALLSSCATIVSGGKPKITIDGNTNEPVTITTSKRVYPNVTLPYTVKVSRHGIKGQRISVTSNTTSYDDIVLHKSTNPWAYGNILFGGIPGWIVDLCTNAVSKPLETHFFIHPSANQAKQIVNNNTGHGIDQQTNGQSTYANPNHAGQQAARSLTVIDRDAVDTNIPISLRQAENTFAVIIGNENYQLVDKVEYASNDANVFAEYCHKTLGIPTQNIRKYDDATYGKTLSAIKDIRDIAEAFDGEASVIFYYVGHGIPDETDQRAYLLPVDADGNQMKACLPLSQLYKELGSIKAKSVVVLLDACFSGSQRGGSMLASTRGVCIKPKEEIPTGNLVVFSAASGNEAAYPYKV